MEDEVRTMLRRARLLSLDDSGSQQLLDLSALKGDRPRKVPRVMNFGFSSSPPEGADFLLLALGGGSSRAMAIGGEHQQYRPKGIPAGSTILYDAYGSAISLVEANIRIVHATEIRMEAPAIVLVGTIRMNNVDGEGGVTLTPNGDIVVSPAAGQNVFLGGDGITGIYSPVRTVAGISGNVKAQM